MGLLSAWQDLESRGDDFLYEFILMCDKGLCMEAYSKAIDTTYQTIRHYKYTTRQYVKNGALIIDRPALSFLNQLCHIHMAELDRKKFFINQEIHKTLNNLYDSFSSFLTICEESNYKNIELMNTFSEHIKKKQNKFKSKVYYNSILKDYFFHMEKTIILFQNIYKTLHTSAHQMNQATSDQLQNEVDLLSNGYKLCSDIMNKNKQDYIEKATQNYGEPKILRDFKKLVGRSTQEEPLTLEYLNTYLSDMGYDTLD